MIINKDNSVSIGHEIFPFHNDSENHAHLCVFMLISNLG